MELARKVIRGNANADETQDTAYNILGAAEAIREKIDCELTLSQADLNYISEHLD